MKFLKTFEKFDKVAFHGWNMDPQDMKLPACEIEWKDPSQDTGCPSFSDESKITYEDELKAIDYLNYEDIGTLIAYSRGAAILLQSLAKGAEKPDFVYLVAPAWKRNWPTINLTGKEVVGCKGYIIHGGCDDKVPLIHSVMLSKISGIPLYIFPECDHIDILKHKDNIQGGKLVKNFDELLQNLPDWRGGDSTNIDVEKQYQISKLI